MRVLPSVSGLIASFVLVFATNASSQAPLTPPQRLQQLLQRPIQNSAPRQAPVIALPIDKFKLLSPGTGWVSTGSRILMTTDNGAHWKDISPPPRHNPVDAALLHDHFEDVFFFDAETGWALYFNQGEDAEDTTFAVSHTADGGATWTEGKLPRWEGGPPPTGSGNVVFADKLHGWLNIDDSANTINTGSEIYFTTDGGKTWLPTKGGVDGAAQGMVAVTSEEVWALGTEEIGNQLDVSRDGGNSFVEANPRAPSKFGPRYEPTYKLPVFLDSKNGYEAVEYRGPRGSTNWTVLFETHDGGHTWRVDRSLSNFGGYGEGDGAAIADDVWIIPSAPENNPSPTLTKIASSEEREIGPHKKRDYTACRASFVSENEGWVNCSGVLSATTNGGANWVDIRPHSRDGALTTDPVAPAALPTPKASLGLSPLQLTSREQAATPAPAASAGVSQHLGFDISQFVDEDTMQAWWNSSPYFDAIFYLPATSHHLPSDFDPQWVSDIQAQGWGLIPTYVGYQSYCACAPKSKANPSTTFPRCNRYAHLIDPIDPSTQGAEEAGKAINKASDWGLADGIIYLDVENFDDANGGSNPGVQVVNGKKHYCSASVKDYVDGFISEMHDEGWTVGIYASASNVAADVAPENPDDIWIAGGRPGVTVWNQGYKIDDKLWPNWQRIHQYAGQHAEIWGGETLTVDSDLVDATIIPSTGTKPYAFTSVTTVNNGTIYSGLEAITNGTNDGTGAFKVGTAAGWFGPPQASHLMAEGFIWSNGQATAVLSDTSEAEQVPSDSQFSTFPYGMNNLGVVVGDYYATWCRDLCSIWPYGFIWTASAGFTTLDVFGANETWLLSINDAGWIAGMIFDADNNQHCVLIEPVGDSYANASFTQFDEPGGACEWAGMNGIGEIVGWYSDDGGYDAFPFLDDAESGTPGVNTVNLPTAGSTTTVAINNNGIIAGCDSSGGVLLTPSAYISFSIDPSSVFNGINDEVEVAGQDANGGFIADIAH